MSAAGARPWLCSHPLPSPSLRPGAFGGHAGHTDRDEGRECRGPVPGGFPQARQPRVGLLHPLEAPGERALDLHQAVGEREAFRGTGQAGLSPWASAFPVGCSPGGAEATILDGGRPRGRKRDQHQRLWEGFPAVLGVDLGTVSWKERTSHCDGPEKDGARPGGGGQGEGATALDRLPHAGTGVGSCSGLPGMPPDLTPEIHPIERSPTSSKEEETRAVSPPPSNPSAPGDRSGLCPGALDGDLGTSCRSPLQARRRRSSSAPSPAVLVKAGAVCPLLPTELAACVGEGAV